MTHSSIIVIASLFVLHLPTSLSQTITYHVKEEENTLKLLGNVAEGGDLKSHVDETQYSKLKFSLVTEDLKISSLFKLDTDSGDLYTNQRIDAEDLCEFRTACIISLEIAATVGSFFQVLNINVIVDDINDNSPRFPQNIFPLVISETSPIGKSFTVKSAIDIDISVNNSLLSYELIPSNGPFSLDLQKNLDGRYIVKLVVSKQLDREICSSYSIQLNASDNGVPTRSDVMTIEVLVSDANDNKPEFVHKMFNVTVKEDIAVDSIILTVSATDNDTGVNSDVFYTLASRQSDTIYNTFSLNESSGELSVISHLTYTPGHIFRIVVEASDKGEQPLISQAIVFVNVLDTNNNKPEIKINMLSEKEKAEIPENAVADTVVAYVRVKDGDTGDNGRVTCDLVSTFFKLQNYDENKYKVVVVGTLNRESIAEHELTVQCRDSGSPPMLSESNFSVVVEDVNDNAPRFSRDTYTASIVENNDIGASIVSILAFDSDVGVNAQLTYSISDNSSSFVSVDKTRGIVTAKSVFDRERQSQIMFQVFATDGGGKPLTATATVLIRISDVNDYRPRFINTPFEFEVYENVNMGYNVGNISAIDLDNGINSTLVYFMMETYKNLPFIILNNGVMKTTAELDRESRNRYDFKVVVSDLGAIPLSNTADVTIVVKDKNDNSPSILYPSNLNNTINIMVGEGAMTEVASVRAYDSDDGNNGKLSFALKSKNNSHLLDINTKTGGLFLTKDVVRTDIGPYTYEIIVSDNGTPPLASYATLNLQIGLAKVAAPAESSNYKTLAIVIVAVTLVLASAIILALVILRKFDSVGHKGNNSNMAESGKGTHPNSFQADIMQLAPPKKVVQFTFPEDNEVDGQTYQKESTERQLPTTECQDANTITKPATTVIPEGHMQMLHQFRMSQRMRSSTPTGLAAPNGNETKFTLQLPNGMDDVHSDSSGDVTTSDSGRGGSVEDVRNALDLSHTDASRPALHSTGRSSFYNPNNYPYSNVPSTFGKQCVRRDNPQINYDNIRNSYRMKSPSDVQDYPYHRFSASSYLDASVAGSGITLDDDGDTTTSGSYTVDFEDVDTELAARTGRCSNI